MKLYRTAISGKFWRNLDPNLAMISHADWLSLSRENETCNALASLSVNTKGRF